MRPICATCECEMKPVKNGQPVIYNENATSYRCGDKYECPLCKTQIVTGFGAPTELKGDPSKWRLQPVRVKSWQEVKEELAKTNLPTGGPIC